MSRLEPELEALVERLSKRRARESAGGKPSESDLAVARLLVLRDVRDAVVKEELPLATKAARDLKLPFKTLQAALGHASPTTIQMWAKMAQDLD